METWIFYMFEDTVMNKMFESKSEINRDNYIMIFIISNLH